MKKRAMIKARCVTCGSSKRKHHAKGMCGACYVADLREKAKKKQG